MNHLSIICCFNNKNKLKKYLLASPDIDRHEIILIEDPDSLPKGYNTAITRAKNSLILCVHQDVIFPHDFFTRLFHDLKNIEEQCGKAWGVIGAAGVAKDQTSLGYLYDCCRPLKNGHIFPSEVRVLDELFLFFQKDVLHFDENIPSKHHFHGVDICLLASKVGLMNFVTGAYCLHMSQHKNKRKVDQDYIDAYNYMRKKWWNFLPIHTTTTVITNNEHPKQFHGVDCLCTGNHE
ncbi:MAG: glycosyltransferase [Planctomycetota bacterium]